MTQSGKNLFRAIKKAPEKDIRQAEAFQDLADQSKPEEGRDPLDYDPTPADATLAFLDAEEDRIKKIGNSIWEPAVGGGHIARPMASRGFDVIGSDVVDRGHPDVILKSLYDFTVAPSPIIITNPPYCEINARDGHGRWLKHIIGLKPRYIAMLLNWDWPAARIHGMDALHETFPISRAYLCCWKIDFRGGGSPPQRNGWFVWDADWKGETVFRRLYRDINKKQGKLL